MKNLLIIKFGKALKTIKKEGLYRGGKRVFASFFALFRQVGSGDILIVTGGIGDSARYRADHHAEELKINGFKVSTTVQDNPFLYKYHRKFKVFIFHRVLYTPSVKRLIKSARGKNKEIIFETDDLVFDKKYLKYMDYFQNMNALERKLYENGVGGEILDDPYVNVCTTTTSFLAEKLRNKGKKVFIVTNKLSKKDLGWADGVRIKKKDSFVRLGYFSGTISHNKDFATITDALLVVLKNHAHALLYLVGPLEVEERLLAGNENRIIMIPFVNRRKYFEILSVADINLAPLETENPFCEAKSELKFFEPGILGIPTVAVRNRTFSEAIEDGFNGFLAHNTVEWIEKITELIQNQKTRKEMGIRARQTALEKYTTVNASHDEYYLYLKNSINPGQVKKL
ncbi:MAG: glycosyltransferase [Desulfobacteraceae bacterium]|nr:MAG: glycosyltransferase [Desulfobacteraceae bacterium]